MRQLTRWLNNEVLHWSYNRQRVAAAGRPVLFQVELTNQCPMRCVMCPRTEDMQRPLGFMSLELFRSIIDQAAAATPAIFLHHFGDSLLHPDIGACIAHARARGIRTCLSANPILLTEPRIRAIVDNGLHEIVLSLDGLSSETSRRVRGAAAADVVRAEERLLALIAYKRAAGARFPRIILQMVRMADNRHETEAWLRKWRGTPGIDYVKVKSYIAWDGSSDRIRGFRVDAEPDTAALVCDKPWTSLTVLWDGRVVPCCFDHDGKAVLGDLSREPLEAVWRGEALRTFRAMHREGRSRGSALCAECKDKEGYAVRRWYYPLNRWLQRRMPLAGEWDGAGSTTDPAH